MAGYASASLAVARWLPGVVAFLPACAFRAVTGLPCPTCGTAHALLALAAGDPASAAVQSPLATLGMLAALSLGGWAALHLLGAVPFRLPRLTAGARVLAARAVAVALLLNWAYLLSG